MIAPGICSYPITYAAIQITRKNELQINVILVKSLAANGMRFVDVSATIVKTLQMNVIETKAKNRYLATSVVKILSEVRITPELFIFVAFSIISISILIHKNQLWFSYRKKVIYYFKISFRFTRNLVCSGNLQTAFNICI
jgi:hypothetical protein